MKGSKDKKRQHSSSVKNGPGSKSTKDANNYRYGPMPRFPSQRVWSRAVMIAGILIYVWYTSKAGKETPLAKRADMLQNRGQVVDCDAAFLKEVSQFPGCVPRSCGRYVSDAIVSNAEVQHLLWLAKKGMKMGGSYGGATILDLYSGALSYGDKFVSITSQDPEFFNYQQHMVYKNIREKIREIVARNFQFEHEKLFITHPTFFSKLTSSEPNTIHDEYWHTHVDKETYENFHYTALVYLNDYGYDFKGGRFVFVDNPKSPGLNTTVEPRKGRVLMFTSGAENPHFVERVSEGERFALTISFTCDKQKAD